MSKVNKIQAEFKICRTHYLVCYIKDKKSLEIFKVSGEKKKKIIGFSVALWNAPEFNPGSIIPWCDSSSGAEGEIAYQMFAPRVYRMPYPGGAVLMATYSHEADIKLLQQRPEIMEEAVKSLLEKMANDGRSNNHVYFTYIGSDDIEEDRELYNIFKSNNFAVFHCVNGFCRNEENYIALYDSTVIGAYNLTQKQAETKEYPKENPQGYIDYKFAENAEESDRYVSEKHEYDLEDGTLRTEIEYYPECDFIFNTFLKLKGSSEKKHLFGASFSVTNFGLIGPEVMKKMDSSEPYYEVGKQLFYPPVKRSPYPLGRVILLDGIVLNNMSEFESRPLLMRDIFLQTLDALHDSLTEDDSLSEPFSEFSYLAYMGNSDITDEDIDARQYEFEFEKDEAKNKRDADKVMYSLCKAAGIPIIRCLGAGKSNFGKSDYIAFVSMDDVYQFKDIAAGDEEFIEKDYVGKDGKFTIPPIEEFPSVITKREWEQNLKQEKDEFQRSRNLKRIRRVYDYNVWDDIMGGYILRDFMHNIQESKYYMANCEDDDA